MAHFVQYSAYAISQSRVKVFSLLWIAGIPTIQRRMKKDLRPHQRIEETFPKTSGFLVWKIGESCSQEGVVGGHASGEKDAVEMHEEVVELSRRYGSSHIRGG
jgi:hypothetical protein